MLLVYNPGNITQDVAGVLYIPPTLRFSSVGASHHTPYNTFSLYQKPYLPQGKARALTGL